MANYSTTVMPKLMALYNDFLQARTEMRSGPKPLVMEALKASDILQPELIIQARQSEKRPVNANWLLVPTSTSGAAREAVHTGTFGDSATEALVWATLTEKFSFAKERFDDNIFQFDFATAWQFKKAIDKIMTRAETAGIAYLESMKSGVNINNDQLGTWNAIAQVFEVAATDISRSPYIGLDNMSQNNYDPMFSVIADNATFAKYLELMAQGQANSANNGWQFFDQFEMMRSSELTPAAYAGISYWFPKNSIGLLTWIPLANREGRGETPESTNGLLTTWMDPRYPGLEFGMSIYTTRTDTSGTNGATQSFVTQVELSLDYVFRKAELSTANETVIQALGQIA